MTFDVWAPAVHDLGGSQPRHLFLTARNARGWHNLARLQPGVSIKQAQAAVALLDAQLAKAYPKTNTGTHHRVVPLSSVPGVRGRSWVPLLRCCLRSASECN